MKFTNILALAFAAVAASAAGPLEIYVTNYHTVDVVQTVTQTATHVVTETHYVSA